MAAADMREGFLCPICMADLGDVIQLQIHFEEKHDRDGDVDFVQNLKELFGKAKRKIMDSDVNVDKDAEGADCASQESPLFGEEPADHHPVSGIPKSLMEQHASLHSLQATNHFEYFQAERAKRADMKAMDTNKLILRLERLMTCLPSDPVKRRIHEQSIVTWLPEDDVKLCPGCAKSFHLTRRKHHCRLCGAVMCADCSTSVSFFLAKRLVNPATIAQYYEQQEDEAKKGRSPDTPTKKTYDHLMSNLGELTGLSDSQSQFRSCSYCKEALEARDSRIQLATLPPSQMEQLYQQLQKLMCDGSNMSQEYRQLAERLNLGEGGPEQLSEAKLLRIKLLKVAEIVETTSKKLVSVNESDEKHCSTLVTLRNRIRLSAINFVKDTLVGLPSVPTEEQLQEFRQHRRQLAAKKIEEEKLKAQEAKLKFVQQQNQLSHHHPPASADLKKRLVASPSNSAALLGDVVKSQISNAIGGLGLLSSQSKLKNRQRPVTFGPGFVAVVETGPDTNADGQDPLVQQMQNLTRFIDQARSAGQLDDARLLEDNLRFLQDEYQRIQEERRELENNYITFKSVFHSSTPTMAPGICEANSDEVLDVQNPFYEGPSSPVDVSATIAGGSPKVDSVVANDDDDDDYEASGKNPFTSSP